MLEHYFTHALRTFRRFKLTTAVNVIGLSLGIVCFVATWLFIDTLMRSDSHVPNASRIYVLTQELWTSPTEQMIPAFTSAAPPVARYLKADFPQLEVGRALQIGSIAAATPDRKLNVFAAAVDPEFLKIFGFEFIAGEAREALAGQHQLVLTAESAQQLFGRTQVVGERVLLQNNVAVTVTGVIAPIPQPSHMGNRANALLRFEVLVPMKLLAEMRTSAGIGVPVDPDAEMWGQDIFNTYVLLPEDGSLTAERLREGLRTFGDRHVPRDQLIVVIDAVPLSRIYLVGLEALIGGGAISAITGLALLDVLILLIACVNYANLAVALATTRGKEIGMRRVLGATPMHLVRQYLIEAGLLGAAALLIVLAGTALLLPVLNSALQIDLRMPPFTEPGVWLGVLLLIGGISLAGGAYPALVLSRVRPVEAVRSGTVRAGPRFVPTLLVGIQFAAASFLLVITLLMMSQNRELQRTGIRADHDPVVVVQNDLFQLEVDFETLRSEFLRSPHIKAVSGSSTEPWRNGGWHFTLRRTPDAGSPAQTTILNQISYDFFETVGLRMLAGRTLDREHGDEYSFADYRAGKVSNVVIDRSLARQLGWPNPADAVGEMLYEAPASAGQVSTSPPLRVVGVVEDGYPRLVGPNTDSNMYRLVPDLAMVPVVRLARENIPAALEHIDAVWAQTVPNAPLRRSFMDDLFHLAYENFAGLSRMVGAVSAFAFVIAMMGLFGMAIHVTGRRTREIGIRKTLGASAPRVVAMLLRDFARPVVIANVIAWPLAFVAGRTYLDLFVQRAELSPWPFVVSLAITVAIAWAAVGSQAVRAASVKPAAVLRAE